jgi:hypothetical protein
MSGTPVMLDMPAFARFLEGRTQLRFRRRNGQMDTEKATDWAKRLGVLFSVPGAQRARHFADMQRLEVLGGPLARGRSEVYYEAAE